MFHISKKLNTIYNIQTDFNTQIYNLFSLNFHLYKDIMTCFGRSISPAHLLSKYGRQWSVYEGKISRGIDKITGKINAKISGF